MSKLQGIEKVVKGWKLLRVMSAKVEPAKFYLRALHVKVEPAKFYRGRLPYFEPSILGPDGKTVVQPGGWRGGAYW